MSGSKIYRKQYHDKLESLTDEEFLDIIENKFFELTEKDFYSPEDCRTYFDNVYIDDIDGGDNFADYANWFYEEYGCDLFGEDWDKF